MIIDPQPFPLKGDNLHGSSSTHNLSEPVDNQPPE